MYQEQTDNMKLLFPEPPVLTGGRISLRPLTLSDSESLRRFTGQDAIYRYLPTFLFEKKYGDAEDVIRKLYDECLDDSLILGVFDGCEFLGLAEVYGFKASIHKASVGYRLLEEKWGQGIATETLKILVDELLNDRGIEIITASTMVENHASARVLQKNGFTFVNGAVDEDWGYPEPTPADKWIR